MYAGNILLTRFRRRVGEQKQRRGQTYPPRSVLLSADAGSDGDAFLTQSDASAHTHKKGVGVVEGRPDSLTPRFSFMSVSETDPSIRAARSLIGPSASLYYANMAARGLQRSARALPKKSSSRLSSLALPETTEAGNWQRPPWPRVEERARMFRCLSARASSYPSSSLLPRLSSYCSQASLLTMAGRFALCALICKTLELRFLLGRLTAVKERKHRRA